MSRAQRFLAVETLVALATKALASGGTHHAFRDGRPRRWIEWDISGRCQASVAVDLFARHSARHGKQVSPLEITLHTKCRKCDWCWLQRRRAWTRRAANEQRGAFRTWFVTLTARPEARLVWHYKAAAALAKRGVDFEGEPANSKFAALCKYGAGPALTRWIKRIRKNSGAPMRYFLVGEMHKDGEPHFHVLIHEQSLEQPIRKAVIKTAWWCGYSKVVLAHNTRAAVYCAKYLTKEMPVRIRASLHYGNRWIDVQSVLTDQFSVRKIDGDVHPSDPSSHLWGEFTSDDLAEVEL